MTNGTEGILEGRKRRKEEGPEQGNRIGERGTRGREIEEKAPGTNFVLMS